jgi:RNA polymerase sigma-70 factor (ECF subfamily)
MASNLDSGTRVTLLGRLRVAPADPATWSEFVRHYGPKIFAWCRRWGAQETDAEEITQMVLLKLTQKMGDFVYDPGRSFRAWLKTITHHAWHDFPKAMQRRGQGSGDSMFVRLLDSVEARDDLVQYLEAEWTREVLEEAQVRVRLRVAPATWDAFRLTVLEGRSGAEAGHELGMPASQVFVYKFRVQKLLEEEMKRLDEGHANPARGPEAKKDLRGPCFPQPS